MEKTQCKLILLQIGSPASLCEEDIKTYLYDFLSNKKVVDLPHFIWLPILKYLILKRRVKKLIKRYEKIWDGSEFLLTKLTRLLCEKIGDELKPHLIKCDYAFFYGKKTFDELIKTLEPNQKIYLLPLFPQYSRSTWGIAEDFLDKIDKKIGKDNVTMLKPFYDQDFYINCLYELMKKNIPDGEVVLISFHSMPLRQIKKYQDPYLEQCEITFKKLKDKILASFPDKDVVMCFQSKFGKGEWAGPILCDLLVNKYKGKNGVVVSPSFVSDSLETAVEINEELKEMVERDGGKLHYVDCLNVDDKWVSEFSNWVHQKMK